MTRGIEVWWSSLLAADHELLPMLDDVERARVASLTQPADQGRSMVAAALLRVAVGAHLGVGPADVVVDRTCDDCGGQHGRPHVRGRVEPVPHVSVSHSGLLVTVALSADAPVGIDVQRVADPADAAETAHRGSSSWARREAVVKAGGGGGMVVRELAAPLDGYVAAVAVRAAGAQGDLDVITRHWPGPRPAPAPADPYG